MSSKGTKERLSSVKAALTEQSPVRALGEELEGMDIKEVDKEKAVGHAAAADVCLCVWCSKTIGTRQIKLAVVCPCGNPGCKARLHEKCVEGAKGVRKAVGGLKESFKPILVGPAAAPQVVAYINKTGVCCIESAKEGKAMPITPYGKGDPESTSEGESSSSEEGRGAPPVERVKSKRDFKPTSPLKLVTNLDSMLGMLSNL
mmetsp:Transcript_67856/g.141492  ORF Transcript_67856/g.141492 Transcript_67856/m.141492 type:complete len:202 (+) Transcript_67856:249-854(+)